jgi:hypothetical protein
VFPPLLNPPKPLFEPSVTIDELVVTLEEYVPAVIVYVVSLLMFGEYTINAEYGFEGVADKITLPEASVSANDEPADCDVNVDTIAQPFEADVGFSTIPFEPNAIIVPPVKVMLDS